MESETRQYELNYLLKESSGLEEIEKSANSLREIIEKIGGIVSEENKPQKKNLSYPIAKHETAYFGWFQFVLPTEKLSLLYKPLNEADVLRFLINRVQPNKEAGRRYDRKRILRQPAAIKNKESLPISITEETKQAQKSSSLEKQGEIMLTSSEAIQVEEIDKKLEEILGE